MHLVYLITIVSILGGAQGLFLTFSLLALKKHRLSANRFLAAAIFVLSLTLVIAFLHFSRLVLHVPHLYNITPIFTLFYGPLLLFYVTDILQPKHRPKIWRAVHFIPVFIFIYLLWPMLNMHGETKAMYLMNIFEDRYMPALNPLAMVRIGHLAVYLAICFITYRSARKSHKARSNGTHETRLAWVIRILSGSAFIWGIYTFLYFYDQNWLNIATPIAITLALYGIGFYAVRFPELFRDVQLKSASAKYEYSRLSGEEKSRIKKLLLEILQRDKLFKNPDLKLQLLAQRLDVSAQNLSQIINEQFNQNFSELINSYRIEEAKKLLFNEKHKHLTLVAIANDVGFHSKSSFNSAFKRITRQTPSEFIKANGL